jgi:hypothetical protein
MTGYRSKKDMAQEPVAWHSIETMYPQGEMLDIRMGDGSILCNLLPQMDGDLWWESSGIGEKFIDPKYADVTHWRIHSKVLEDDDTQVYGDALTIAYQSGYYDGKKAALAGLERNFCERCGKRTKDIHTCTPPQEKNT